MRKNSEAPVSSGATDSSDEAPVTGVERCGGVVRTESVRQPRKGEERASAVKPFAIDKRVVLEAWRHVKANRGAAGIDRETIEAYEANLKDNLYRVWNRMSSGSYMPPAVRLVEIPKKAGGVRTLGIPTVEDRIAQTVVKTYIEPSLEQLFHPDSYGYRPGKSALQAVEVTRERCLERNWVVEFDIQKAFDELAHTKVMRMVRMHVKERWAVMYIERWLKSPFVKADGTAVRRSKGVPQGSVIGPVLMNLFMTYAFDRWMQEIHPYSPFARYADDAVAHCWTEKQAHYVFGAYQQATGEVWVETQSAEVLDRVLPGQSSSRSACVQAVYLLGLHLQAQSRQKPPRQDHPMLPAWGESRGEDEDAANDQELEADAANPGQHRRAGSPIQPYIARMVELLWSLLQNRAAQSL